MVVVVNIDDIRIDARARRVVLAAVMLDRDAVDNILDEHSCPGCTRELAKALGWLAASMLIALCGRADAEAFALDPNRKGEHQTR